MSARTGWSRFDPMSGSWPMVLVDLVVVVLLGSIGRFAAQHVGGGRGWLVFVGVTAALVFFLVAVPLRVILLAQRGRAAAVTASLTAENARRAFEVRLGRALDMADDESVALTIAMRAIATCGPGLEASVQLADNSDAHLQKVMETPGASAQACCDVATPRGCPAIRFGQRRDFLRADSLDTCPHLVGRGSPDLAAVCVPITLVGRATGVVHVVRDGAELRPEELRMIETVAQQAGQRVGLLRATAQAQLQASTDPLTGLHNRRSLENWVRDLVRDHVPYAVAMCDLDHFKQLNDTHGHDTGDRALRLFARTLRNTMRSSDFVARHGGEEFVVVMPNADAEMAAHLLDRARLELLGAVSDGQLPGFTMSAGIADSFERDDYPSLLVLADERLMQAKQSGRDRVVAP